MLVTHVYPQHVASYNIRRCYLCKEKFKVKKGDVMVTKRSKHARLAHPKCAVEKNWVDQKQIDDAETFKDQFIQTVS